MGRSLKTKEKRKSKMKKRSTVGLILDLVLTICTGGLWLIWILIRYLRKS